MENIKLYSRKAITLATGLGGPLAAGILIRKNYLNLGKEKEGLITLTVGIICTVLLFWGISSTLGPIIDEIPYGAIPMIYTGIIHLIVGKIQGQVLEKHKEEGHEFYSGWRAAGIGMICAVFYLGGIFAYSYAFDNFDVDTYEAGFARLDDNETEAMKLYEIPVENKDEILRFIEQTGIPKWKEDIEILNGLSRMENLPEVCRNEIRLYLEYAQLRIETFELISKAIALDTSEYDEE
ncbi:MAG: hypothetical protein LBE91_22400, partial [Tannerella sp.]|nr:hypothetical protein [Tannerella sp.]